MADTVIPPELIAGVRAETDRWAAGLRERLLGGSPSAAYLARRIAAAVGLQHPCVPGLGAAIVTAAVTAFTSSGAAEVDGAPLTATGLAELLGAAGVVLSDQERAAHEAGREPRDVKPLFAAAVRRERASRGWTAAELARRSGVTHASVSNLEGGVHGASLHTAEMLAAAFGLPVGALVDGTCGGAGGEASDG